MMEIWVLNGPNLNLLGIREPEIYGRLTLADLNARLAATARELGATLEFFQSNHEGALIDRLQAGHGRGLAGAIFNPGGLTHTSIALHDAIKAVDYPVIEVHLSNLARREPWRAHSYIAAAAVGTIAGLGWRGYELALRYLVARAVEQQAASSGGPD
ncbi:MAG: type II 3-dehydroquinate dehydratase [Chloroflexota bacterium]|nr:type II 3-dehydroquinate dehydratase [Dehalococcoidia bacterium]MDW8255070.1 type II 3-dehydroquinate dehydratase [Chloroflexota bacterium]